MTGCPDLASRRNDSTVLVVQKEISVSRTLTLNFSTLVFSNQFDEEAFDRSFGINVKGPFFSFRRCCRCLRIPRRLCSPRR